MNAPALIAQQFAVTDMERIARAFAASKLFGVQNPEQALALCLVAQAEGRHPATAAQDYSIIQGRPSKKADAMLRDFIASGGKVDWHALNDDIADATFSHPAGGSVRIAWDMQRASRAGLGGNAMYKKYPRQMLRSRTVSEGVRTVCPGATSGMYVPEEVHDIVSEAQPTPHELTPSERRDVTPAAPRTLEDRTRQSLVVTAAIAGITEAEDRAQLERWLDANEPGFKDLSKPDLNAIQRAYNARFDALDPSPPAKTNGFDLSSADVGAFQ